MSDLKAMEWDEGAWEAVKRASSAIPPFARAKSLRAIIEASEWAARDRGSERVEICDVVRGVREKAPETYRDLFLDALKEQGVDVSRY